jgi:hypothetical protein
MEYTLQVQKYPLKEIAKAQNKVQQLRIYIKTCENIEKRIYIFNLLKNISAVLKMKLNHLSIYTGQGNQLVPLLPSAPYPLKSQRDNNIGEVLKRYAHTIQ